MRIPLPALLVCAALTACASAQQPVRVSPGHEALMAGPFTPLVRSAIRERHPEVLARGLGHGATAVYLVADGRGRIVASAADDRSPPVNMEVLHMVQARFPALQVVTWTSTTAYFPTGGIATYAPGEMGPDTVWVIFADAPVEAGTAPFRPAGPYLLGRTVAVQTTPTAVLEQARHTPAGEVFWYAQNDGDDDVIASGTLRGEWADLALADSLEGRFPGHWVRCSNWVMIMGDGGRLVPVMSLGVHAGTRPAPKPDAAALTSATH